MRPEKLFKKLVLEIWPHAIYKRHLGVLRSVCLRIYNFEAFHAIFMNTFCSTHYTQCEFLWLTFPIKHDHVTFLPIFETWPRS